MMNFFILFLKLLVIGNTKFCYKLLVNSKIVLIINIHTNRIYSLKSTHCNASKHIIEFDHDVLKLSENKTKLLKKF
jgi:hypothetical protein